MPVLDPNQAKNQHMAGGRVTYYPLQNKYPHLLPKKCSAGERSHVLATHSVPDVRQAGVPLD